MAACSILAMIGDLQVGSPIGPMLGLAVGAALIVLVAEMIVRAVGSADWRRAIWQTAFAAMLLLVLLEVSGAGNATRILGLKCTGFGGLGDSTGAPLAAQDAEASAAQSDVKSQPCAPPTTCAQTPLPAPARLSDAPAKSQSRTGVSCDRSSLALERAEGVGKDPVESPQTAPAAKLAGNAATVLLQGSAIAAPESFEVAGVSADAELRVGSWQRPWTSELSAVSADADHAANTKAAADASSDTEVLLESIAGFTVGMPRKVDLWLLLGWAAGAAVATVRLCWAWLGVTLFCRRCRPLHHRPLEQSAKRIAAALGLRRPVALKTSARLAAPVACGVLRPQVVVPQHFVEEFTPPQQEAVLAHELAHLAAADPLWQALAAICCAAMWWHPLVWWAKRRLLAACETAADEASLLVPHGPDLLASCLVAIGRKLAGCRPSGGLSAGGVAFRSALGQRVGRLLQLPSTTGPVAWPRGLRRAPICGKLVLPIVFVLLAVVSTGWIKPQVPVSEGGSTMSVVAMSWRCSLMAAALWGVFGLSGNCGLVDEPAVDQSAGAFVLAEDQGPEARGDRPAVGREGEGERGDRRPEGDRPGPRDQERRADPERPKDRPREGERPPKGDQPRDAERPPKGDQPRDAERPRGEAREGERPDREAGERERPDRPPAEAREGQRRDLPPEVIQRRRELEAKAREIRQRLEQLGESQQAEARELREALERIMRELRQPPPDPAKREGRVDRQRLEQHIAELERRLAQAREARRADEVERLERELDRAMQALRAGPPEGRGPVPPEVARRLEHLHVAIQNLLAAGLPEQAEHLARLAERLRAGEPMPRPEVRPGPPREGGPEPELFRAIRELNAQLEQMRREMHEIRENLRKVMEK